MPETPLIEVPSLNVIISKEQLNNLFINSSYNLSMIDTIQQQLDLNIKNNVSMSTTTLPLYWLDVGQQISFKDIFNEQKYFEMKRITIPLTYNGTMSMELMELN